MPEYIAKIKGTAKTFGSWSGPYDVKEERTFFAEDDMKAYEVAKNSLNELNRRLLSPRIRLDSLVQIKHVDLSTYA